MASRRPIYADLVDQCRALTHRELPFISRPQIAELQKRARAQPLDQQQWLHSMLQRAEKEGMAQPGMSEKFKPQPPEGQTNACSGSDLPQFLKAVPQAQRCVPSTR